MSASAAFCTSSGAQEDLIDSLVTEVGDYAETLDKLRPYMADHPFRTVADALELMEARK